MSAPAHMMIDSSLFREKTLRLLRQVGMTEDEFVGQQAALLFRDLSKFTPPFGGGVLPSMGRATYGTGKDKKAGEIAVRRDVSRSMSPVAPPSRWRNPKVQAAVRRKNIPALQTIFDNAEGSNYQGFRVSIFNESLHVRVKDRRGRVNSVKGRLVLTKTDFNRYKKKVLQRVGRGKALFASASIALGGRSAPAWISRHFGSARAHVAKGKGYVQARASGGALTHTLRFLPSIEKNRAASAEKRLLYLTKQAIKSAGFRAV